MFKIIIPARHASSRLPAKPLADIAGKPMIVRVVERATKSGAGEVIVATDHRDVATAARQSGVQVVMTRADHATGTDRLAEVVDRLGWPDDEIVVNVQGDEPLVAPELIGQVARSLRDDAMAAIATVSHPISSIEDFLSPNVVKVVCDAQGYALYFSRAPIPWPRDAFAARRDTLPDGLSPERHIGLYAYRAAFLRRYRDLELSPLEKFESLEQLRALWHGYRIRVVGAAHAPEPGVDTVQDLERVRRRFAEGA